LLIIDDEIVPLCESALSQFREEYFDTWSVSGIVNASAQNTDASYFPGLLRARCKRPSRRRAAEKRDERAPSQLIE
jgi:hypothetical protein